MAERTVGNSENLGGSGLYASALGQGTLEQSSFDGGDVRLHTDTLGKRHFWPEFGQRPTVGRCSRRFRLGAFGRKLNVKFVGGFKSYRPLYRVLQLPDISRPLVAAQSFERRRMHAQDAASCRARVLLEEVIHQHRYVFVAFA